LSVVQIADLDLVSHPHLPNACQRAGRAPAHIASKTGMIGRPGSQWSEGVRLHVPIALPHRGHGRLQNAYAIGTISLGADSEAGSPGHEERMRDHWTVGGVHCRVGSG